MSAIHQGSERLATLAQRTAALKQQHWKAVMEAGFLQYRVGTYEDGADGHFSLPSTDSEELQLAFHNRLMLLCQVSLQSFSEAIENKAAKKMTMTMTHSKKSIQQSLVA